MKYLLFSFFMLFYQAFADTECRQVFTKNENHLEKAQQNGWGPVKTASGKKQFRSFNESLKYMHSVKLSSHREYLKWNSLGLRPSDIPFRPQKVYKDEWQGLGYYLGTSRVASKDRVFRPFEEALSYMRSLNLSSQAEFKEWSSSGERPSDIPSTPSRVYKDEWQGLGYYLGTSRVASKDRVFRPFEEALSYVRPLKFSAVKNYYRWSERPRDIPFHPDRVYKTHWKGWRYYLGLEEPSPGIYINGKKQWSFKTAKKYVKSLNFENIKEFIEWLKSDSRPLQFPANPHEVYSEWVSAADFLDLYWPYQKSQVYVQGLFLQGKEQFIKWALSDERPKDFPFNPQKIYKDQWEGWPEFLGAEMR